MFQVEEINKLEDFKFYFHFEKSALKLIEEGVIFDIFIIMENFQMAGIFSVTHYAMTPELISQTRLTILSVFFTGILFFIVLFTFIKLVVYYWKKTHPRRVKGEVSQNTERENSCEECEHEV